MTRASFHDWLSKTFFDSKQSQSKGISHSLRIGGATTLYALHDEAAVPASVAGPA